MKGQKLIPLLVIVAGLLAYYNSLTGAFLFDDVDSIVENVTIRHLWPIWATLSPPAAAGVGGRPVVNLSFAINYAFGGTNVRGYHALSLAIHILAGLTLFGVVRRTLLRPMLRGRYEAAAQPVALAVAILWIVHPLQTEAVTYLTQRAESLMGLFYLLTLYCVIRGIDSTVGTRCSASEERPRGSAALPTNAEPDVLRSGLWFTLSVVACLLGMGSKEVMVSAPVMVLLYDRTFVAGSFREAWTRRWRLYAGLAGTWVPLGYLMTSLHNRGVGYGLEVTWRTYALSECWAIARYLRLALWPHPLVFDYGREMIIPHAATAAPYALILLLLVTATVIGLKWRPALGFVGVWFFAILAPTSSVVPVANQPVAENRMYLPLVAVIVLVVLAIHALVPLRAGLMGRRSLVAFLAMAVGLGFLTTRRNEDYHSELSIWGDTVAKRPGNARALFNFGNALLDAGRTGDAIDRYEQALRINPYFSGAHNSLGIALAQEGRVPEAIEQFELALQLNPNFADAHYNLAMALLQLGKLDNAIEQWKEVVRLKPDDPGAHNNLGIGLSQTGKIQDAVEQFEQAVRLKPDWAEGHYNLGNALLQLGRVPEAAGHFEQAVRLKPDFAPAQDSLARLRALSDKRL